ncbi:MarR family transcriptional regulator [Streptomyces sp. H10-C2]|uniref:MarR family transcriptional regulator n=1 Tax=unclassified Streptomyces TaxID=2593676 RepID=UPI0024B9AEC6|nr:MULTISPECIES: MarR family transcriptional regulator [unclassified Streptomyces]MDJ0346698.1 MarR family transcriptional regulator [Streptomyces sp. PH10-H1]MDJ0374606.1 MarR family transcriptional regulator [Streptomyces sp. H10-C2]
MTVPAHAFDPESLATPPLYSLNLSAAQRSLLAWMEDQGAYFQSITFRAGEVAAACGIAESTAYDALSRLTAMNLVLDLEPGYKLNARLFFTNHPEVRDMMAAALADPMVHPDERARAPRKRGNTDARRRRDIRAVPADNETD